MPCTCDLVQLIWLAIGTLMLKASFANSLLQATLSPRVMLDWHRYCCGLGARKKLSPGSPALGRSWGQAFSSVTFEDWPSIARAGSAEAVSAFEEARDRQLDSTSSEGHFELGKTDLATHRVHDAVTELQESLRLDPGSVQAQRLLRQAYRRAGDERATSQEVQAGVAKKPSPEAELLGEIFAAEWEFPGD